MGCLTGDVVVAVLYCNGRKVLIILFFSPRCQTITKMMQWKLRMSKVHKLVYTLLIRFSSFYREIMEYIDEEAQNPATLTHHILAEPDPTVAINVNTNTNAVERSAGQVNEMPAPGPFVDHALLHGIDIVPGRC